MYSIVVNVAGKEKPQKDPLSVHASGCGDVAPFRKETVASPVLCALR